jgi:hypothetical protein
MPKGTRKDWMLLKDTQWQAYTAVRGIARNLRVTKDNPPAALRGLVLDFDANTPTSEVLRLLKAAIKEPDFMPNWIERSLSDNVRLVYTFKNEILVPNGDFARGVMKTLIDKIGGEHLLAGYDHKSSDPHELWTSGALFIPVKADPMPWAVTFGLASEVSQGMETGLAEIPLEILHAEIERRWPGRWKGPFTLGATGQRFWDDTADNPTGCQVKPDGMLCFTGRVPFMKWEQLFGLPWCESRRAVDIGEKAGEIYFDGRAYYHKNGGKWCQMSREDVMLHLKNKGLSTKAKRGHATSDAERVLAHIQTVNRVDGAAPVVNRKPGITFLDGNRILNTSPITGLQPAAQAVVSPETDCEYLWDYLTGLFDSQDLGSFDHWLAWLRRFYTSVLEYRPLMGQAVFLCGPRNNGKTLLAYRVIKPLVGDRASNPYDYFTGQTPFNAELFESPLLLINDEEAISDYRVRMRFLARIKSFVVNPAHMYHRKFGTPFSVEWTGRLFSTLNDDASSVGVLPEVNENTADKLMFFRSRPRQGRWGDNHEIEAKIAKELPLFARWLLNWTPPEAVLADGRMGVKSFFDPYILTLSNQQNNNYHLIEIIKHWIKSKQGGHWAEEDKREIWIGDPTQFFSEVNLDPLVSPTVRGWDVEKCARALQACARISGSGVAFIGKNERTYQITRSTILKLEEAANETQENTP